MTLYNIKLDIISNDTFNTITELLKYYVIFKVLHDSCYHRTNQVTRYSADWVTVNYFCILDERN